MTSLCEEYLLCHTVEEAIVGLASAKGQARILAGGSDLLVELHQGFHPPVPRLVDVSEIEELRSLEIRDHALFIGAAVTLACLAKSSLVKQHAQVLSDAAGLMGNPQVCNVATIGGNVAHALPAADGAISLLALDAQVEIANPKGRHRQPLKMLFKGLGESSLHRGSDVLVGLYLPLQHGAQGSAFARRVSSQGIPLALLNVAVWLKRSGARLEDIRIVVGPSGPVPSRASGAEDVLRYQKPSAPIMEQAVHALVGEAHLRTSHHRATLEYRQHLAGILLDEAFHAAWQRARGEPYDP
jgi:CO/xanthine dehydrogenase FAD-binding subunit